MTENNGRLAVLANYKTDKIKNSHAIIFYNHVNACIKKSCISALLMTHILSAYIFKESTNNCMAEHVDAERRVCVLMLL